MIAFPKAPQSQQNLNFDTVTLIFELAIYIHFLIGHVGWGKGVIYNDYHFANCDSPVLPTHFQ